MATFDSADLLSRCQTLAARPATDTATAPATWYSLLTEAQAHWYNTIVAQVPWVLMNPPTLLVSTDGGTTYPFPGCVFPLSIEVYDALDTGRILKPSAYWDPNGDYIWEGDHIRFPQGQQQTFSNGPFARYVSPPGAIDASTQPTLVPSHARLLLVYRAVAEWANRGGFRDPAPFYDLERRFWYGNPQTGDVGLLGMLKQQNPFQGGTAYQESVGGPLEGVSTGAGYRVLRLGSG